MYHLPFLYLLSSRHAFQYFVYLTHRRTQGYEKHHYSYFVDEQTELQKHFIICHNLVSWNFRIDTAAGEFMPLITMQNTSQTNWKETQHLEKCLCVFKILQNCSCQLEIIFYKKNIYNNSIIYCYCNKILQVLVHFWCKIKYNSSVRLRNRYL
jgi:hypothetical protein